MKSYIQKLVLFIFSGVIIILMKEVEYHEFHSPDGKYAVILTHRLYLSLLPIMPSQSGDKPGFVSIYDIQGHFYGKIPIPMLSMGLLDFKWTTEGATIKLIGGWHFKNKTYYYWNKTQTQRLEKRV